MGDLISFLIDFILHIDQHLDFFIGQYGALTHLILFLVVFCETGLVVTPFLPGDSLIFAAGALSANENSLNVFILWILLVAAAILGDTVNYHIGKSFGRQLVNRRIIKQKYIEKTEHFFEKHGGKTIIIARFIPIVRTFAPFVAGIGQMSYSYFFSFNVIGGLLWVTLFLWAGFFFGGLSFVEDNFTFVILAIIAISLLPPIITWLRSRLRK